MSSVDEEKRVVEYDILGGATPAELVKQVKDAIRRGWEPQGGMATIAVAFGSGMYYQTVTRKS